MKNRAKFFSPNYREARKKFLKTAEQNNLKIETYTNPKTGYDGESLHTDVLWIGSRNAENILVTTSGTHGPEGHLGSAAQIAALSARVYTLICTQTWLCLLFMQLILGDFLGREGVMKME